MLSNPGGALPRVLYAGVRQNLLKLTLQNGTPAYTAYRENPPPPGMPASLDCMRNSPENYWSMKCLHSTRSKFSHKQENFLVISGGKLLMQTHINEIGFFFHSMIILCVMESDLNIVRMWWNASEINPPLLNSNSLCSLIFSNGVRVKANLQGTAVVKNHKILFLGVVSKIVKF